VDSDAFVGGSLELPSPRNRPLSPVETIKVLVRDNALVGHPPGRDLEPGDRFSIEGRRGPDGHLCSLLHDAIMSDPTG
jgi:hypothetical protein